MTAEVATLLTPEQATRDALGALWGAGLGREAGKPFTVVSRAMGYAYWWGGDTIETAVEVKAAGLDTAMRALLNLPGVTVCNHSGTVAVVYRLTGRTYAAGES